MTEKTDALRAALIRNFHAAPKTRELRAPLYDTLAARLATGTAARGLGISVDTVAPGMRSCPYHFHHANEEAFVVLEGEGQLRVAGEMLVLVAGDVVFIPPGPEYPHQIVNGSAAPLVYLSISTQASPEIVEYPDSNKYLAVASGRLGDEPPAFCRLHRASGDLDYWDGEP